MNFEEFKNSLVEQHPPGQISDELTALWWDMKDEWDKAHEIVQRIPTSSAAWIHAYLHRKEPDRANASYWYSRAGRPFNNSDFDSEWEQIVRYLLLI